MPDDFIALLPEVGGSFTDYQPPPPSYTLGGDSGFSVVDWTAPGGPTLIPTNDFNAAVVSPWMPSFFPERIAAPFQDIANDIRALPADGDGVAASPGSPSLAVGGVHPVQTATPDQIAQARTLLRDGLNGFQTDDSGGGPGDLYYNGQKVGSSDDTRRLIAAMQTIETANDPASVKSVAGQVWDVVKKVGDLPPMLQNIIGGLAVGGIGIGISQAIAGGGREIKLPNVPGPGPEQQAAQRAFGNVLTTGGATTGVPAGVAGLATPNLAAPFAQTGQQNLEGVFRSGLTGQYLLTQLAALQAARELGISTEQAPYEAAVRNLAMAQLPAFMTPPGAGGPGVLNMTRAGDGRWELPASGLPGTGATSPDTFARNLAAFQAARPGQPGDPERSIERVTPGQLSVRGADNRGAWPDRPTEQYDPATWPVVQQFTSIPHAVVRSPLTGTEYMLDQTTGQIYGNPQLQRAAPTPAARPAPDWDRGAGLQPAVSLGRFAPVPDLAPSRAVLPQPPRIDDPIRAALASEIARAVGGGTASPLLERTEREEEDQLRNRLFRQLGAGYEVSTPGIEALQRMRESQAIRRENNRQQTYASLGPQEFARRGAEYQVPLTAAGTLSNIDLAQRGFTSGERQRGLAERLGLLGLGRTPMPQIATTLGQNVPISPLLGLDSAERARQQQHAINTQAALQSFGADAQSDQALASAIAGLFGGAAGSVFRPQNRAA